MYSLLTNQIPLDSAKRAMEIWEGNLDPLTDPSEINPQILILMKTFSTNKMKQVANPKMSKLCRLNQTIHQRITVKYFLALPLIGILSLAVFGGGLFGIISLMNYSNTPIENNTVIENTNTTPEVTPSIEENINASDNNAKANTETTPNTKVSDDSKKKETLITKEPSVQPTMQPRCYTNT